MDSGGDHPQAGLREAEEVQALPEVAAEGIDRTTRSVLSFSSGTGCHLTDQQVQRCACFVTKMLRETIATPNTARKVHGQAKSR